MEKLRPPGEGDEASPGGKAANAGSSAHIPTGRRGRKAAQGLIAAVALVRRAPNATPHCAATAARARDAIVEQ
jgi:hypothetical protein